MNKLVKNVVIMDYKKKIREYLNNSEVDQLYKSMLLNLFPELKESESEDEMVIEWCVSHFRECSRVSCNNAEYQEFLNNKIIPWFEKQGEKDEEILVLKDKIESLHAAIKAIKETHRIELEKQGEQKPADKVEPKFKVGDWLVENEPNNYARFIEILEVIAVQGKERYRISRDLHNDEDIVECRFVENNYHPFNIQDAKDGDVLVCEDFGYTSLMLFESFSNGRISLHCWHNSQTNNFHINTDVVLRKDVNIYPATKEQRDTLMKAMTDAGYTFDFEKKELKKMEGED